MDHSLAENIRVAGDVKVSSVSRSFFPSHAMNVIKCYIIFIFFPNKQIRLLLKQQFLVNLDSYSSIEINGRYGDNADR